MQKIILNFEVEVEILIVLFSSFLKYLIYNQKVVICFNFHKILKQNGKKI